MILCEKCNKNPATVSITQIINSEKTEMYLCKECAKLNQGLMIDFPFGMNNFLGDVLNSMENFVQTQGMPKVQTISKCGKCNSSYEEFIRTGMLGCPECYDNFEVKLMPILQRLHGSKKHVGKIPRKLADKISNKEQIENLKKDLQKAVSEEDYETAATLRDKIKDLEKLKGEDSNSGK